MDGWNTETPFLLGETAYFQGGFMDSLSGVEFLSIQNFHTHHPPQKKKRKSWNFGTFLKKNIQKSVAPQNLFKKIAVFGIFSPEKSGPTPKVPKNCRVPDSAKLGHPAPAEEFANRWRIQQNPTQKSFVGFFSTNDTLPKTSGWIPKMMVWKR